MSSDHVELPERELLELALEAIGEHAAERLRPLLSPAIRIVTERGAHEGIEAALAWAAKRYQHLDRRFAIDSFRHLGDGVLGSGRVQYVWRESGEVGDSAPIWLALRLEDGLLSGLTIHEQRAAAEADLRGD